MAMINRNSFQINGAYSANEYVLSVYGTVELTIGRETRRVRAIVHTPHNGTDADRYITAYGITGRYRTGMKAWPGHVSSYAPKLGLSEHVSFGRDDRARKFRKATISFA